MQDKIYSNYKYSWSAISKQLDEIPFCVRNLKIITQLQDEKEELEELMRKRLREINK